MKVSSKAAYGLQALFDLAFHGVGRAVQARELAERQGIPLRYLEQILQELRRAGLVEAKRGPGGGYGLARPPAEVRLDEVTEALDGPIAGWPLGSDDPAARVWGDVAGRVQAALAQTTLADLVGRAEAMGIDRAVPVPQMYFI